MNINVRVTKYFCICTILADQDSNRSLKLKLLTNVQSSLAHQLGWRNWGAFAPPRPPPHTQIADQLRGRSQTTLTRRGG